MEDVLRGITTRGRLLMLMRELAMLTGESEADALVATLEERVARLKGPATREERIGRVLAALRPEPPTAGRRLVSRIQRDRALGYGKEACDAGRSGAIGHSPAR